MATEKSSGASMLSEFEEFVRLHQTPGYVFPIPKQEGLEPLLVMTLGLAAETGEVLDEIKKSIRNGTGPDLDKLRDELGDCLHYLTAISLQYSFSLDEIIRGNITKLQERHTK